MGGDHLIDLRTAAPDEEIPVRGDLAEGRGRHEDRRVVLDEDRGTGDAVSGLAALTHMPPVMTAARPRVSSLHEDDMKCYP